MTLEAWSTWYSIEVSQDLGTKSSNGFGDRLGPTTSEVVALVGIWLRPCSDKQNFMHHGCWLPHRFVSSCPRRPQDLAGQPLPMSPHNLP
jgi:hypothetical protein